MAGWMLIYIKRLGTGNYLLCQSARIIMYFRFRGQELPFPGTESFADAEFLIGGNRPKHDLYR